MIRVRIKVLAGAILALTICLSGFVFFRWNRQMPTRNHHDVSELAEGPIIGEWNRIEKGSDGNGKRVFSESGDFWVRYGDMTIDGRYQVLGPKTLETRDIVYGETDRVYRWTFGFKGGHLIMVNQDTGWVEEYTPAKR